jgi:hypothetical protein
MMSLHPQQRTPPRDPNSSAPYNIHVTIATDMFKKRVLVGYGIDVDAVANHINTTVGGAPNLTNVSRGKLGATKF